MGEYGGGENVAAYFEDDRKIKNVGEPSSSQKDNNALQHDQHVPSSSQKDRTPCNYGTPTGAPLITSTRPLLSASEDAYRRGITTSRDTKNRHYGNEALIRFHGRAPLIEDLFAGSARSQPSVNEDAYGGGIRTRFDQRGCEQTSTRRLNPSVTVHPPERKSTHHVNPTVETTEKKMEGQMRTAIKCHCRVPCAVMKSWTRDNPGRRFMSCKFRHCDFWQWLDFDQSEWQRNAINQVILDKQLLASEKNLLKSENDHLKENNDKLKAENSLLRSKIMDLERDVLFPAYERSGPSLLRKAFYALIFVIIVLFFMYVNVV